MPDHNWSRTIAEDRNAFPGYSLHKVDPHLKLGGPIFTGQNEDINYLSAHGGLKEHTSFILPAASITLRRGKVAMPVNWRARESGRT
jgi:hypothetical protein